MKLRELSDRALAELGAFAASDDPEGPHAQAPKLWLWLLDSAAAEQARRRGSDERLATYPAFPAFTSEEYLAATHTLVAACDGMKRVAAVALAHGRVLTDEALGWAAELRALFGALANALLNVAEAAAAEPLTVH